MNSFESHILGEKPVLVDFYADWCRPCKMMEPILKEVKETTGDRATVLKINIDNHPDYAQMYNVYSIPSLIIFQKGNILWRKNGMISAHEILQELKTHLQ